MFLLSDNCQGSLFTVDWIYVQREFLIADSVKTLCKNALLLKKVGSWAIRGTSWTRMFLIKMSIKSQDSWDTCFT